MARRIANELGRRFLHGKPLKIGDTVSMTRRITKEDVERFVELSGDANPVHSSVGREMALVPGALLNCFVSGVIGSRLPGPGTLVVSQSLNFPNKCYVDDLVTVAVTVRVDRKIMKVDFCCVVDASQKVVLEGDARLVYEK